MELTDTIDINGVPLAGVTHVSLFVPLLGEINQFDGELGEWEMRIGRTRGAGVDEYVLRQSQAQIGAHLVYDEEDQTTDLGVDLHFVDSDMQAAGIVAGTYLYDLNFVRERGRQTVIRGAVSFRGSPSK